TRDRGRRLFPRLPRRAGGGVLLRSQRAFAQSQPVRHASQIRRRDACRRGDARMKPPHYGPFPYSPIPRRPPLSWPDGAHVALWVIPNIEFFSLMEKVPAG